MTEQDYKITYLSPQKNLELESCYYHQSSTSYELETDDGWRGRWDNMIKIYEDGEL